MANKRLAFKLKCPMTAKYISDIKDLEQKSWNTNFFKKYFDYFKKCACICACVCMHVYLNVDIFT